VALAAYARALDCALCAAAFPPPVVRASEQLSPNAALPPPLRPGERRSVQLNGDPKCGTTLTETIAFIAAELLCTKNASAEALEAGAPACRTRGQFDQNARKEFDVTVPSKMARLYFSIANKHAILGTHGGVECQRGEPPLAPPGDPCGYDYARDYSLAHLRRCIEHCVDPHYDRGDLEVQAGVVVLVWRDVRNQVISQCFSERDGNHLPERGPEYRRELPQCVSESFARIALWSRYRQLWFSSVKFPRTIVNICYERLLKEPLLEYKKVFAALGLPASDSQLRRAAELAQPGRQRASPNSDMARKVRDAGARDYRGYGLPTGLVEWMDQLYANLSFEVDSPCISKGS